MADPLAFSVSSLQSSLQLLESSINTLDAGVNDFPRLTKVLQTTRHYELLPEPHLHDAQAALRSEITPSITHLLQLAGNHVEKLKRREESLRAKSELQEGRIEWGRSSSGAGAVAKGRSSGQGGRGTSVLGEGKGADKAAELQRLRQKKERLKYAVERLELQSKQRQRELRRSVGSKVGSDAWGVD